jgi:hypothetical protein
MDGRYLLTAHVRRRSGEQHGDDLGAGQPPARQPRDGTDPGGSAPGTARRWPDWHRGYQGIATGRYLA